MKDKRKSINILFICRYNRFRSRVAEAYFKKINKNKKIKVDSAGAMKGTPVDNREIKAAKKFGLKINGKTKGISSKLLTLQDICIIVADDVPTSLIKDKTYNKGKTFVWNIKDGRDTQRIINQIMKKVDKLNKDLESGKIKWKQ